jgi:thioredoxin reductase (NADPH)
MSATFDVTVAGSGIGGLTAALTCARLGWRTLVLTGEMLGGQLLSIAKIDGFPGFPDGVPGYELCPMIQEQAVAAGAGFQAGVLQGLVQDDQAWRLVTSDGEYTTRALVLATGSSHKELGIPGEARLRGRGVSHCASCDAPLLRERVVAVVGGGDSAAQEALTLAEFASRVIILHRGEALSAQAAYRAGLAARSNVEIRYGTIVEEIFGDDAVGGIRIRQNSTNAASELEVRGVFIYVGLRPNTEFLHTILPLDDTGRIPVDGAMRTSLPGVCAIGASRSDWGGRAAISAGDGARAAIALDRYLREHTWREQPPMDPNRPLLSGAIHA